jgi:tight adherence protein C
MSESALGMSLVLSWTALGEALRWQVLLWPLLFGAGAYLLLTAQPIGRPKPDLAARLRRLDVDERVRMELERREAPQLFASRLLEALLRPVLDDAGRLLQRVFSRLGVGAAAGGELERSLRLARPEVEPAQFFGEKVLCGAIGLALFPAMGFLGVAPFGPWPVWVMAAGFAAGFLAPDWHLEQRLAERRTAAVMELSPILDLLTIAVSAGLALEQALELVARRGDGVVAGELRVVTREVALGQRPLVESLEAMAERNGVSELTALVGQLRAAHEQGIPLVQTLSTQAETLRDRKRLRVLEAGGKASVRMVLPVALFILPVIFVVLLVPAGIQLTRLAG